MAGVLGSDCVNGNAVILCLEASKNLLEPLCTAQELQQELVPYVLNHSLQSSAFLKLPKAERQLRVKALTQQILSGEAGSGVGASESPDYMKEADSSEFGPQRFWAYLRSKYGTLGGHLERTLQLLEPQLRERRVVVLRFEGESAVPSASLLVRASAPCSAAATSAIEAARLCFSAGAFDASAVSAWLAETPNATRAPPLWARLVDECNVNASAGACQALQVLLLCTDMESTDTGPKALTLAAHLFKSDCNDVPYMSSMHFGPQSSERLAALQDICAWSGGLTLNVDEPSALQPSVAGLASYLFDSGRDTAGASHAGGLGERREFYLKKQSLGTCFLSLPMLAPDAGTSPASECWAKGVADITNTDLIFDAAVPSDSMLNVLSDVSLNLPRRWSRSLRCWREFRGLRDVVFSEPGGLGLELDEPDLAGSEPAKQMWRLRATHPPASSLKIEEHSQLVAVNMMRVHSGTTRGEVAKRVACRPVSLTFRCSSSAVNRDDLGMVLSMAAAEIVVSELRERYPPIKTKEPPLSVVIERVSAAGSSSPDAARQRQAAKIIGAALQGGSGAYEVSEGATWVKGPSGWAKLGPAAGVDALTREPALLYRLLLFCGSVASLARAGLVCRCWWQLSLDRARAPKEAGGAGGAAAGAQRRLWRWTLRWGEGPPRAQRPGFWRWCRAAAGAGGAPPPGGAPSAPAAAVLDAAMRADASGLLRLSQGLDGAAPGLHIAAMTMGRVAGLLGAAPLPPRDIVEAWLRGPLHGQRCWLLSSDGLPWLVSQCRSFQIELAAHCPQLFRHFMGEGLAPELFFCWWLERLLHGCVSDDDLLQIWDLLVFEQSYKIFIRIVIAIFKMLEPKLRGDIDQIMKVLFNPKTWGLGSGALLKEGLGTKVTRSVLRDIQGI